MFQNRQQTLLQGKNKEREQKMEVIKAKSAGFCFGTGSTAPTENDYILESQLTTGFTAVLTNTARGVDSNDKPYAEYTFTVTNTGSSTITISEIGIITNNAACCTSSTGTTASNNAVLIDRTLLDSAVTIAAGNSAAIKYRLTSDMIFQ